ncbi:hypothetical protein L107_05153 [Cyanobium sp. Copco_Reservoir_LC18]|nr:hypothetical protein L107_05153 [Cyanobium sp. Copco_Reservoir_LC18]
MSITVEAIGGAFKLKKDFVPLAYLNLDGIQIGTYVLLKNPFPIAVGECWHQYGKLFIVFNLIFVAIFLLTFFDFFQRSDKDVAVVADAREIEYWHGLMTS